MNVRDWIISQVRTYVPVGVGALISWLASVGLDVGAEAEVGVTVFLTALIIGLYYLIARTLEARWPKLGGVLLGSTRQPEYAEAPDPRGVYGRRH